MNCIMFTKKDGKESNYAHKRSNFKIKYCILIMKLNEKDTNNTVHDLLPVPHGTRTLMCIHGLRVFHF